LIQATAADMMRLVMIRATEEGICVCAVLHDGFLIEADADKIEVETGRMRVIMDEVAIMVAGAVIPVDVDAFAWPDCYTPDEGDAATYATIMRLLDEAETATAHGAVSVEVA
jgi:DNA polymerase I